MPSVPWSNTPSLPATQESGTQQCSVGCQPKRFVQTGAGDGVVAKRFVSSQKPDADNRERSWSVAVVLSQTCCSLVSQVSARMLVLIKGAILN